MDQSRFTSSQAAARAAANQEEPYSVALRRGTLELGYYSPVGVDHQGPHEQDEVYMVVSGSGHLLNDGVETQFGPGDALFVPAGVEHRFFDFSDETEMWVVFYGPSGCETGDLSLI